MEFPSKETRVQMSWEDIARQYQERAESEIEAGTTIERNDLHEYMEIKLNEDNYYYFSDHEYHAMVESVPDELLEYISVEEYFLAQVSNW